MISFLHYLCLYPYRTFAQLVCVFSYLIRHKDTESWITYLACALFVCVSVLRVCMYPHIACISPVACEGLHNTLQYLFMYFFLLAKEIPLTSIPFHSALSSPFICLPLLFESGFGIILEQPVRILYFHAFPPLPVSAFVMKYKKAQIRKVNITTVG